MATSFEKSAGKYKQTVEDSGDGQSSKKFGNCNHTKDIEDSGNHNYNQKSGGVKDSGE